MFETGTTEADNPLTEIRTTFVNKRARHEPLVTCGRYDVKA